LVRPRDRNVPGNIWKAGPTDCTKGKAAQMTT